MEEGEKVAEVSQGGGEASEGSGSGFFNRRLHNYPLIKVHGFGLRTIYKLIILCKLMCQLGNWYV